MERVKVVSYGSNKFYCVTFLLVTRREEAFPYTFIVIVTRPIQYTYLIKKQNVIRIYI